MVRTPETNHFVVVSPVSRIFSIGMKNVSQYSISRHIDCSILELISGKSLTLAKLFPFPASKSHPSVALIAADIIMVTISLFQIVTDVNNNYVYLTF